MLKNKKSKTHRMRGTSSHGWGHKKKHRGKGHRGGVGLSGTGARGDAKKPSILTKFGSSYFGKRGFKSILKSKTNTISLRYIENHFDKLVETEVISKKGTNFIFDTTKDYDKVLGKTKFTKKVTLIVNEISESAKAQVEAAGGKVEVKGEVKE